MKRGTLLLSLLLIAGTAFAQHRLPRMPRTPSVGFGLQIGNPEGAYEQVTGTPVGFNANLSIPTTRWSMIELGGDASFHRLGTSRREIPVYDNFGYQGLGKMKVSNSVQHYHLQARLKPFGQNIRPYVDGLVGMKQHVTSAKTSYHNGFENVTIDKTNLERDWTTSYGFAVGLQVQIARNTMLDIKHQRLEGGSASFVDPNSMQVLPDGAVQYDQIGVDQSKILMTSVGLTFNF